MTVPPGRSPIYARGRMARPPRAAIEHDAEAADPSAPGGRPSRERLGAAGELARASAPPVVLAAAMIALGFSSGGFYPRTQGLAAVAFVALAMTVIAVTPTSLARLRGPLLIAVAAFCGLAAWTLLSGSWSGAQGRASTEFDRVVLYAAALVSFGLLARGARSVEHLLGAVAAACMVLCLAALMTRLLPDTFTFGVNQRSFGRLQYPVTYSSTLGLLATLGGVLVLAFAASPRHSAAVRIAGAAATPVFATTLLLTYSRGPMLAAAAAAIVFLVAGLSASTAGAVFSAGVPAAAAAYAAYQAERLASPDFTSAQAVAQGHRVALVVAGCVVTAALLRGATLGVDRWQERITAKWRRRRYLGPAKLIAGAVAVTAVGLAIELPALQQGYTNFSQPGRSQANVRARLTEAGGNDRLQAWRIAIADFRAAPLEGRGAGTFVLSWNARRPYEVPFDETHSLYLQMLGELGIVGFGLLLVGLGTIVVAMGARARGPDRVIFAGALAAAAAWAVAVSVDWHWQMPVGTLWLFAVGGAVLGGRGEVRRGWPRPVRWLAVIALGVVCILPVRVAVAEDHLAASLAAFRARDFAGASAEAQAARSALGALPAPLMLLGYCAAVAGDTPLAIHYERRAVSEDPNDWTFEYALATVSAQGGVDPRPAARAAHRLNPLEPLVGKLVQLLHGNDPEQWKRQVSAVALVLPTNFD